MKKILAIFTLLFMFVMCLTGCGKTEVNKKDETSANDILNNNKSVENEEDKNTEEKTLVVYFSKTGENYNVGNVSISNTAMMASYIKEYLNADSFEIAIKDLDFSGKTIRVITTHEGSGLGSVVSDVKKICKGANVLDDALAIRGSEAKNSKSRLEDWI